ncbi:MAG: energy-coupling factor transporter ATPase [Clostridia bacterium]|nr:energy-coupling factor transporter ATPase [Clostridia bacterium]
MEIKAEQLGYTYMAGGPMEKVALHDVDLEIKSGSFVGIIGHTGSGKSTLIQHFNGLMKPTSGKLLIDGKDITSKEVSLRELRFKVGMVFQYPEHQLFDETVYNDIAFGPKNMKLEEAEIRQRVQEAANAAQVDEAWMNKSPFELSGGQKRRVAIAGVLAMRPEVLVLDEPAAGLDPKGRDEILQMVAELHQQRHMTVILVSHSMEDIAKLATQIIVMNEGTVAMQGTVSEVFSHGDELQAMGLDVPQITLFVQRLIQKGYPLSRDIFTVEQARQEILALFQKEQGVKPC